MHNAASTANASQLLPASQNQKATSRNDEGVFDSISKLQCRNAIRSIAMASSDYYFQIHQSKNNVLVLKRIVALRWFF